MHCVQRKVRRNLPPTTPVPRLGCISDLAALVSGSVKYRDTFLKSNMEPQIFEKKRSFERKPPWLCVQNLQFVQRFFSKTCIVQRFWRGSNSYFGIQINEPNVLFPHGRPTSSFVSAGHFTFALDLWNPVSLAERRMFRVGLVVKTPLRKIRRLDQPPTTVLIHSLGSQLNSKGCFL